MGPISVYYLGNSGFAVELESRKTLLIFDYHNDSGDRGLTRGTVDPRDFARYTRVLVFVSHSHADHYNPIIRSWARYDNVSFIISEDVEKTFAAHRVKPGKKLVIASFKPMLTDIDVDVFGSTDLGVSYQVKVDGWSLFHAGDLNCWHWQDESTAAEARAARTAFKKIVSTIVGRKIDIAFFPVDPRQGSLYDEGALMFMTAVGPRAMVPMHFGIHYDAVDAFEEKAFATKVIKFTMRGQEHKLRPADIE